MNPDELVEQAVAETGLSDFGDPAWRDGFDHLVDSLDREARLNDIGRVMVPGELTGYLKDRLGIVAHRAAHPEITGIPIIPPIVIVGQGRTGTTILYDLLAQDPNTRVPVTWEVDKPLPPPETATFLTDPRIEEVDAQLAMVDLVLPEFRKMHPMGARLAQECVRITGSDFRSMIFPTQYHVPGYGHWLLHDADMASAYRWHRVFLEHLQSRHPTNQWVLKSPGHIWCLDALLTEYPDALLVQTHRDPLRIIASIASLVAMLRSIGCDDPTIPEAATEFAEYIIDGLDRSVDARENGTVDASRVIDTQFADFMRDPFVVIRSIYEHLDLELTPETEQRMRDFLAEHPSEVGHRYTWDATGLDAGEWRERARRYQDFFAVPDEALP
jgi:hypothetical protein